MSSETSASAAALKSGTGEPERVVLVAYPKIVFLWPSFVTALVAGIIELTMGGRGEGGVPTTGATFAAWAFLIVLSINLVVLSFDFPRATSLIIFFIILSLVLALFLVARSFPTVLPRLGGWIGALHPAANATFYFFFASVLGLIYAGVLINIRFDYWEVRPNELLHHHGFLSDLERFSAPNLRIDKEINDIFEYVLLGSGRLILHPSNERRAVVLENVFRINRKEQAITKMLGALQVQVRTEPK
jgi:hypothetical protein